MSGCVRKSLFDPSYTTDGVSPMHPWGRTRHALNPAVPTLIDRLATGRTDLVDTQQEINEIAEAYGELLQDHAIPGAGVALACAALRHAFEDTARWVVRRRVADPDLATAISMRAARLAESAIETVNRSYDEHRRPGRDVHAPLAPSMLDLLAFAAAVDRVRVASD